LRWSIEWGHVWESKKNYESLEAALEDAEQGISKWISREA
jgi:hypothetical protein